MTIELTLPQRLYLLSFDTGKNRLDPTSYLVRGALLRAAAAAELTGRGLLRDDDGKAARSGGAPPDDDVFLAKVFEDVPAEQPRRWADLMFFGWETAEDVVAGQLGEAGVLEIRRKRVLGLFPARQLRVPNPEQVRSARQSIRDAALLGRDPASVTADETALALLAAEGDVGTVFGWRERGQVKDALSDRFDTVFPGLRKATRLAVAACRSSASA